MVTEFLGENLSGPGTRYGQLKFVVFKRTFISLAVEPNIKCEALKRFKLNTISYPKTDTSGKIPACIFSFHICFSRAVTF